MFFVHVLFRPWYRITQFGRQLLDGKAFPEVATGLWGVLLKRPTEMGSFEREIPDRSWRFGLVWIWNGDLEP